MSLAAVPLLIVALLMASADGQLERVELLVSGDHDVTEQDGTLIIGDARVTVDDDSVIPGPIYVTGGELVVRGRVTGDVVQLAGTVRVDPRAQVGGQLRHVGGTQRVDAAAEIGSRSSVAVAPTDRGMLARWMPTVVTIALLGALGALLARRRADQLDTVGEAVSAHPVVTLTVGALLTLTFLSLFVFMAFTLVLIPVAVLGGVAGAAVVATGLIALGRLAGRRIPVGGPGWSTALGVVGVTVALQLVSMIPLVGNIVVIGAVLASVGAVLVTYFGLSRFRPDDLSEPPPASSSGPASDGRGSG